MMSPATCPDVPLLRELLHGRLPPAEQAALTSHLDDCPGCQQQLERLAAGESAVGLPRLPSLPSSRPEDALRLAMDALKARPDPGLTDPGDDGPTELPADFLDPPAFAGQLGRLAHYEVISELGRGGMGLVYKAFDPALNRFVAVKVLAPHLAGSEPARRRFEREARAAAAVRHDDVVAIHAVDEFRGLPYLVMEYVDGGTLQKRLDREGPLELAEAIRLGLQAAAGLAAAHAGGLIHRDIKPSNLLFDEAHGRVKLTDFGLARAADDVGLTRSGVVVGTPQYMAPEQVLARRLDARADLFSLGAVLYALCTGRPPFHGKNTLAVLRQVAEEPHRPVRDLNPDVPEWLARVIDRLLAKDPEDRFRSAAEVVKVLRQGLAHLDRPASVAAPVVAGPRTGWSWQAIVALCAAAGFALLLLLLAPVLVWFLMPSPAGHALPRGPDPEASSTRVTEPAQQPVQPRPEQQGPGEFPLLPPWAGPPRFGWEDHLRRYDPSEVITVQVLGVSDKRARELVADRLAAARGPNGMIVSSDSGDGLRVTLAPVLDLEAFRKKIDFGEVEGVKGRVIRVQAGKLDVPADDADPVTVALFHARFHDAGKRRQAAQTLAGLKPTGERKAVLETLDRLVKDPDAEVRRGAAQALAVWGGKETVPVLVRLVNDSDPKVGQEALQALSAFKDDERAAEAVARRLGSRPEEAKAILRRMGAAAEPAVRGLLDDGEARVRIEACDLLKEIGNRTSLVKLQEVAAKAEETSVRIAAEEAAKVLEGRLKP